MGRGTACNSSLVKLGGLIESVFRRSNNFLPLGGSPFDISKLKIMPTSRGEVEYMLTVDGNNFWNNYQEVVSEIHVRECQDHRLSTIKVVLVNDFFRYTNEAIWRDWAPITIHLGYRETGLKRIAGNFLMTGPKFVYPKKSSEKGKIIIEGVNESVLLGLTEKRRVWENRTDSDVAAQIAVEYGWTSDIDSTLPLYEHIAQVNESDWTFLNRRAQLYGFSLYVDNGTLHFHKPRYHTTGLRMVYYQGQASQLDGFVVENETFMWGSRVRATQVDPLSKELIDVIDNPVADEITQKQQKSWTNSPVQNYSDMSWRDGVQTDTYMVDEGHRQALQSLQNEVTGWGQHNRWLVHGDGSCVGYESLKVGDTIEFVGLGKNSGEYFITDVWHDVVFGKYTTKFAVVRTWAGSSQGSFVKNEAVDLVKAGEVFE